MASSLKRERQLARERYERQQARRAAARARQRQLKQVTAVVLAVLAVIGGMVFLTTLGEDDVATQAANKATVSASPSASASESPSGSPSGSPSASATGGHHAACTYAKGSEKAAKDVGVPVYDEASAHKPFEATLKTDQGDITIAMETGTAACTTSSFKHLASKGYFDKTTCHRVTTEGLFVLQCGDPTGTGGGGPGYGFGVENAPADGMYPAGTVAMARSSDPNSNGSQFFLVYKDTQLPTDGGGYTIFGRMTKGIEVVSKVAAAGVEGGGGDGPPAQKVTINSVAVTGS